MSKDGVDDQAKALAEDGQSKALTAIQSALTWAYDSALDGIPGLGTLDELIADYLNANPNSDEAIDSLINWQISKAATSGFVTGLGGIITLPVAVPANLASVLFVQLRMIAGIAKIRGYDVHSDQVRTLCVACLAGSAVTDILKDVGINLGVKLTQQAVMKISGAAIIRINQAVGFRLITKAGSTGFINLTKMVPFIGGIVGGSFDAVTTMTIASTAKSVFTQIQPVAAPKASVVLPSASVDASFADPGSLSRGDNSQT